MSGSGSHLRIASIVGLSLCLLAVAAWVTYSTIVANPSMSPMVVLIAIIFGAPIGLLTVRPSRGVGWLALAACVALVAYPWIGHASDTSTGCGHVFVTGLWVAAAYKHWRPQLVRPAPSNLCRNCGYDLTGNTSGVCPECGAEK